MRRGIDRLLRVGKQETKQNNSMIKTIEKAESFGAPFDTENGPLYNIGVRFTDGSKGIAYAKSDTPPYGPGDAVEVVVKGKTAKGTDKLKIKKAEDGQSGSAKSGGGGYDSRGARTGCAVNNACLLVAHGKLDMSELPLKAAELVRLMDELESAPAQSAEERDENGDFPF